ncbi:MAG: type II 3-dehydroquinate dehydratase [Candidatus Fimenecus sp.]
MKILVINGPNLNLLGIREPTIYGGETYETLLLKIDEWAKELGCEVKCFQSNHEGGIVDEIHAALGQFDGIVINAGAYTHTSIAILDALKAVSIPAVEVHISDLSKREDFRQISYLGLACCEHFVGFGTNGYRMAMEYLCNNYN